MPAGLTVPAEEAQTGRDTIDWMSNSASVNAHAHRKYLRLSRVTSKIFSSSA